MKVEPTIRGVLPDNVHVITRKGGDDGYVWNNA